jgi:hypothetical protein
MQAIEKGISFLQSLFKKRPNLCHKVNINAGYTPNAAYPQPIQETSQPNNHEPVPATIADSVWFDGLSEPRSDMPPIIPITTIRDIPQQRIHTEDNIIPFPSQQNS